MSTDPGIVALSNKHFSRFGEFLVSFELSRRGWNVYTPVYDEYIDLIAQKHVCTNCNNIWKVKPELKCLGCNDILSSTETKKSLTVKRCPNCNRDYGGEKIKCDDCLDVDGNKISLISLLNCHRCKIPSDYSLVYHKCECGNESYNSVFRTIQVKSSRIEVGKNSYAIDMQPKDLFSTQDHFFIWCCVDNDDNSNFLVMSVNEFKTTAASAIKTISFIKGDGREHFNSDTFGNWSTYLNKFDSLD